MKIANEWQEYECIDAGNGEKLERWGNVILRRPDPQAIWPFNQKKDLWKRVDGHYHRSSEGGGHWDFKTKLPDYWTVNYKNLTFKVSPTNFKHTGLFPEQAVNWDYIMNKIKNANRKINALNLFAYTGAATMAASSAGADYADLADLHGRDNALAAILSSLAHELTHYYQWINVLPLTDRGRERQASIYARRILDEYAETREHP